jgi:hypothetical protein
MIIHFIVKAVKEVNIIGQRHYPPQSRAFPLTQSPPSLLQKLFHPA